MATIGDKILSGAMLMMALRLCLKSMGMVSTIILARILQPEDFGLIAMVMSVYAFVEIINAFGFDVVLIQNQKAERDHYNTSWTLKAIFGLLACVVMVVCAPLLADFYGDERVEYLSYFASGIFVINGLCNIGTVNFRKDLDFRKEFYFEFMVKLFAVVFTLFFAYIFMNYWALVLGMVFNSLVRLLLSYWVSDYRPRFCLSKSKELFSFSGWLLVNNLLIYLNMKSKDLIIGKMVGIKYVGHYSIADEIANLPSTELVASINRATFPGYSKVSDNRAKLKELYLSVLASIAIVGVPSSLGLALVSPYFVMVVLGENWLSAIPVFHVLAIAGVFICINTNVGYVFMAIGKPKYTTALLAIRVFLLLSMMILLTGLWGYMGAAYAVLITSVIMFPIFSWAICFCLNINYFDYCKVLFRPLLGSVVMYLSCSFMFFDSYLVPTNGLSYFPTFFDLLILVVSGASIYIAVHILAWIVQGRPLGVESLLFDKIYCLIKSRAGRRI